MEKNILKKKVTQNDLESWKKFVNQFLTSVQDMTLNSSFFGPLYEDNVMKSIGIFVTIVNILITSPCFYSIIWYEKFGSNHKRTLLNQVI